MSFIHLPNRALNYLLRRKQERKAIREYKTLSLNCATPADFPDAGYFYRQQEMRAQQTYKRVISKLPKKKRILIAHTLGVQIRKAVNAYHTPDANGFTPADYSRIR